MTASIRGNETRRPTNAATNVQNFFRGRWRERGADKSGGVTATNMELVNHT